MKKSNRKSQSKKKTNAVPTLSQTIPSFDVDIEEKLDNVQLKRPVTKFTAFIREQFPKLQQKKKDITLGEVVKSCKVEWDKMSPKDKDHWNDVIAQEKKKFEEDCGLVRHYLLGYNKEGATAYRIFLDNKLKEAFEADLDPKDAQKQAAEEWDKMSPEDKLKWKNLKKENDSWWKDVKKLKNVNAYAVFVQEKICEAKDKGKTCNFKDCSEMWKKAKRKKYEELANKINEEKAKKRDIYEIAHCIKPTKPLNAFTLFLKEIAKEGKLKGKNPFVEGRKLWNDLSDDEKEGYLKKQNRQKIVYKYKLILFKKNLKKSITAKRVTALNLFMADLKNDKKKKLPEGKTFFEWARELYNNLSETKKGEYEEKAKEAKEEYDRELSEKKNELIHTAPKKNLSAYTFYFQEKMKEYKEKDKNKKVSEIAPTIADEWNNLSDKEKKKYEKMADADKDRYKCEKKEFDVKGYYNKNGSAEKSSAKKSKSGSNSKSRSKSQSKGQSQTKRSQTKSQGKKRGESKKSEKKTQKPKSKK